MARAAFLLVEELATSELRLSQKAKNCLKKISLAAAFRADSSFNALQLNARAMVFNVIVKHNIWLQ